MASPRIHRNIRYRPDPEDDIGQSSEYHIYDNEIFVSGMTGFPENMDYDGVFPSLDRIEAM